VVEKGTAYLAMAFFAFSMSFFGCQRKFYTIKEYFAPLAQEIQ